MLYLNMEQIVDDTATIQDAYKLIARRLHAITTAITTAASPSRVAIAMW